MPAFSKEFVPSFGNDLSVATAPARFSSGTTHAPCVLPSQLDGKERFQLPALDLSFEWFKPKDPRSPPDIPGGTHDLPADQPREPEEKKVGFFTLSVSFKRIATLLTILGSVVWGGLKFHSRQTDQAESQRAVARRRIDDDEFNGADVKVYAGTTQEHPGYMVQGYGTQLLKNLKKPDIQSLDQAHAPFEQGFPGIARIMPQVAVSTPKESSAFDKRLDTPRYAILIAGDEVKQAPFIEDSNGIGNKVVNIGWYALMGTSALVFGTQGENFAANVEDCRDILKSEFGMPDKNIAVLHKATPQQIDTALARLHELPPHAEVLIFIAAHGGSYLPMGTRDSELQGAYEGFITLNNVDILSEQDLRDLIKKYLPEGAKISIVIDSCHSGAFIDMSSGLQHRLKSDGIPIEE